MEFIKETKKKLFYIFKDHSGKSSIINSKATNDYIFAEFRNYLRFLKKFIKNVKKEKFVIKIDVEGVEENVIKELIKIKYSEKYLFYFCRNSKPKI